MTQSVLHVLGGREVHIPDSFGVMGIVNCTPDSFYQKSAESGDAFLLAQRQRREGADILDIGGESSRPGAEGISAECELRRILPLLLRLQGLGTLLSVDTWHARTAVEVLERGAHLINDISAFSWDVALLDVLAHYKPGYVLMHSQGRPECMQQKPTYTNVVDELLLFFEQKLDALIQAGVPENRILIDPGIGFGKRAAHNLAILQQIERFAIFGRPILMGLSMKSFFGDLLGAPLHERQSLSATASALLWEKGVFWHRVHNVAETRKALFLARSLQGEKVFSRHKDL